MPENGPNLTLSKLLSGFVPCQSLRARIGIDSKT